MRDVGGEGVGDGDGLLGRLHAHVHVDAEDLEPAGQPLHLLDQSGVPRIGADLLLGPVREGVRARADEGEVAPFQMGMQLGQRLFEVGPGFHDRRAHTGDDLDGGLEQLVLGLGVKTARLVPPEVGEDLGGRAVELSTLGLDDLQFHLDAEARAVGGVKVDLHRASPAREVYEASRSSERSSALRAVWGSGRGWALVLLRTWRGAGL